MRRLIPVLTLTSAALLSGCVVAPPPQRVVYAQPAPAPIARPVPVYAEYGRVENIGTIALAQRPSGAGALLGAVIGGLAANHFGAGGGRALMTGAGIVGGAVAGNAIEGRTRRPDEAYRVQVRFDNGTVREFDFQQIDDLRIGDRVKLDSGQLHRV